MTPAPKGILSLDIETFPILGFVWQTWEANVLKVVEDTSIACYSAKWLQGKQVTRALSDYPGYRPGKRDDKKLLQDLWQLLDEADIVVAHNGDRFDVKKINYRFMVHGMRPPSPYRTVDTLKEVKKVSSFDSHKLDELSRLLEHDRKVHTGGFSLWEGCMAGDASSWNKMKEYNAYDVILLEKLYLRLLPWMKGHPNVATGYGPDVCPKCQSTDLIRRGMGLNKTTAYQRYQCRSCGAWCRDHQNTIERENRPFVAV